MLVLCLGVKYFVSFLVLQSSCWEIESWLQYVFWCHVAVIVLFYFLVMPRVGLKFVIVVFHRSCSLTYIWTFLCLIQDVSTNKCASFIFRTILNKLNFMDLYC